MTSDKKKKTERFALKSVEPRQSKRDQENKKKGNTFTLKLRGATLRLLRDEGTKQFCDSNENLYCTHCKRLSSKKMTTTTEKPASEAAMDSDDIISNQKVWECHSLPCNIDFAGRAPVEVYFTPHLVSDDTNQGNSENRHTKVYSSQFRGRQLLALDPMRQHSNSVPIQGRLLEVDACKPSSSDEKIQVKGKFSSIFEWKHENEPAVLQSSSLDKSRVGAALQWCDVAQVVSNVGVDCGEWMLL